jgi:hypothetical protein
MIRYSRSMYPALLYIGYAQFTRTVNLAKEFHYPSNISPAASLGVKNQETASIHSTWGGR